MGTEVMGLKREDCVVDGKGVVIQTIAEGRRARTQNVWEPMLGVMELKGPLPQVSPLFGTICDAVVLLAHTLSRSESHGAGLSEAHLGDHTGPLDVADFSQRIRTDGKGRRLAQYVILDTGGRGSQLVPTHILDTDPWQVKPLNRAIHFPGGAPPACNSSCWFDPNTLCKEIIHHLPIHPSTHPPICPSVHPFIHFSIICLSIIHSLIHPSIIHQGCPCGQSCEEQEQGRDLTCR